MIGTINFDSHFMHEVVVPIVVMVATAICCLPIARLRNAIVLAVLLPLAVAIATSAFHNHMEADAFVPLEFLGALADYLLMSGIGLVAARLIKAAAQRRTE